MMFSNVCAVAWLRWQATGAGGQEHEPDEEAPLIEVTTSTGWVFKGRVCRHCGCVYIARRC